jgi:predicted fused transcriptional regulator/phosphomethylpyrimidine kinase
MNDEKRRQVLEKLGKAIRHLDARPDFFRLIPEVGSNFVYCLPDPRDLTDVAGLTGRIIRVRNIPNAVGEIDFGWAPFMGQVILEAYRLDHRIRSAISIRSSPDIIAGAHNADLSVKEYQLPSDAPVPECLTVAALKSLNSVPHVLFDHGAHGLEALGVVFGKNPEEVVQLVDRILRAIGGLS